MQAHTGLELLYDPEQIEVWEEHFFLYYYHYDYWYYWYHWYDCHFFYDCCYCCYPYWYWLLFIIIVIITIITVMIDNYVMYIYIYIYIYIFVTFLLLLSSAPLEEHFFLYGRAAISHLLPRGELERLDTLIDFVRMLILLLPCWILCDVIMCNNMTAWQYY